MCSANLTGGMHEQLIYLLAFNIFLSITAFLGNTLILVALHKESSLHPPQFQTLVSLSGKNWSLRWSYFRTCPYCLFDFPGSRRMESLSLLTRLICYSKLYFVCCVFVNNDFHKRWQTSRPVVRAEIQTSCNFKANVCGCSCLLGYFHCCCSIILQQLLNYFLVWQYNNIFMCSNFDCVLH